MDIVEVQKKAIPQIKELIKKEPESIASIEKSGEGWTVQCHFLEKKSVPETYDLLKIFEFKLDKNAKITEFKQVKKVRRGDLG
ncbi:gas vesicle protein [Candidatus Woesearchaeota archaeon]|nr:gas vesicle protein [Candidatus Woesearchaeota archaeon]